MSYCIRRHFLRVASFLVGTAAASVIHVGPRDAFILRVPSGGVGLRVFSLT
jgi:hypothetical protein